MAKAPRLPVIPPLARHEVVDLALREHARRLEIGYMDFIDLAREAIDGKYYEHFRGPDGQIYLDPAPYFQDRVGIAYRSVRRRLSILEGVLRLPESEQAQAKVALAAVGSHKAGEIARILGRDGGSPWRDLIELAQTVSEDALREEISARLGTKPRGLPAGQPGDRFLRFLLANVPPDVKDYVEQVISGLMRRLELTSPVAAFLVLIDLGHTELAAWEKPEAR